MCIRDRNNCEQANIDKIVETATKQLEDIRYLKENLGKRKQSRTGSFRRGAGMYLERNQGSGRRQGSKNVMSKIMLNCLINFTSVPSFNWYYQLNYKVLFENVKKENGIF